MPATQADAGTGQEREAETSATTAGLRLRMIARAAGSGIGIAVMALLAAQAGFPLVVVPFATSIVLVMGSPEAKPAQPRALVGGHLVSTMIGLAALHLLGPDIWAAAVGVGLATAAMQLTRTFHPPAGIDPLVVVTGSVSWSFLLVPVAVGAILLAGFAFLWHRAFNSGPWPTR